jgi:hypothetical protein
VCESCPSFGAQCSVDYVEAQNNYYLSVSTTAMITSIYCQPDHCTNNVEGVSCATMVSTSGVITRSCCGVNRLPPDSNLLCGQCKPGYSEWGGRCVACESTNGGLLFLYVLISMLFVGIFHKLSQKKAKRYFRPPLLHDPEETVQTR